MSDTDKINKIEEKKISESEKNSLNVKSVAGSRLSGTVTENKNVFDKLTEFLIGRYNGLIDEFIAETAADEIGALDIDGTKTTVQASINKVHELINEVSETAANNVLSLNEMSGNLNITDGGGGTISVITDSDNKTVKLSAVGTSIPAKHGYAHSKNSDDPAEGLAYVDLSNVSEEDFEKKIRESTADTDVSTEFEEPEIECGYTINSVKGWNRCEFEREFSGIPNVTATLENFDGTIQIKDVTEKEFYYQIKVLDTVTNRYVSSASEWTGTAQNIVQGCTTTSSPAKIQYIAVYIYK